MCIDDPFVKLNKIAPQHAIVSSVALLFYGMRDFYISDPHFGHRLVSRLRGYENPRAHDRDLYEAWMDALPAKSEIRLWILGDNSCGSEADEDKALALLERFREDMANRKDSLVYLHGILGNHDHAHPLFTKSHKHLPRFLRVYDSIQLAASANIAETKVMLSHFPYDEDHHDSDQIEQFRLRDLNAPIIHGHTHSNQLISFSRKGSLQICVCVEAMKDMQPMEKTKIQRIVESHYRQRKNK